MADVVSAADRSRMMSGIRNKNTKPELIVRKGLHARGFRFRLHDRKLAGKPDLVLRRHSAVIFVNGCFWHGHTCHLFKEPKTRKDFWETKLASNKKRDVQAYDRLRAEGWRIAEVWECATKGKTKIRTDFLIDALSDWLRSESAFLSVSGA